MSFNVKVGGVWKTVVPQMRVGGVWKTSIGGWVKVAGVWRKLFPLQATGIVEVGNGYDTNAGNKTINVSAGNASAANRFIALVAVTGSDIDLAIVSDDAGGTWTKVSSARQTITRGSGIWIRTEPGPGSPFIVTMNPNGAGNSGGGLSVRTVQGALGLTLRQVAKQDNSGASAPVATFPVAVNTDSVLMGIVMAQTGSAGVPTGWGYGYGISYTVPAAQVTVTSRLSGETGTTITFPTVATTAATALAEFTP